MDELVRKIRELNDSGLFTKGKISEMTGVSISSVKRICSKSYDKVMERRVARKLADEEFDKLVIKYLPLSNSYNHLCTYLGLRGVEGYYNKIKKVIKYLLYFSISFIFSLATSTLSLSGSITYKY